MAAKEKTNGIIRGIVIMCYGHAYYGRYGFNLASTIKATEPDMPIAVVACKIGLSHLSEKQKGVFDIIIDLPENIDSNGFSPKLYLNELSPFKETLFLDADMLWLPNKTPSQLFDELSPYEYTGITEGYFDIEAEDNTNANLAYYYWGEPLEIKQVYKLTKGKLYQWRSEVIYFKKNATTDKFFKKAQSIMKNPKIKSVGNFGGHVPDELAINIAAAIYGMEPHEYKWTPAFWNRLFKEVVPDAAALLNDWYLVSFGSNHVNGTMKKIHDRLVQAALYKLGMQHVFPMHSKADFLNARLKM